MPRGRHRNSSAIRRLLPPLTVSALAAVPAIGAVLRDDAVSLRVAVAWAVVAGLGGALLLRIQSRASAEELSAELAARARAEDIAEQRIAELGSSLEGSEQTRTRVERQLARQRDELARRHHRIEQTAKEAARLRTEVDQLGADHAATLQGRAEEAAARRAAEEETRVARDAARTAEAELRQRRPAPVQLTPTLFKRALSALEALPERGAAAAGRGAELARPVPAEVARRSDPAAVAAAALAMAERAVAARPEAQLAIRPVMRVVPAARVPKPVLAEGRFSFFARPGEEEDVADVVGDEAVHAELEYRGAGEEPVIDLTEHDETETLNVVALRREHA